MTIIIFRHLSKESLDNGVAATFGEHKVLIRVEFEEDVLLI